MNTNLPLVPRTSDGPTWSNGWAATGAHLDMIAKQYKNGCGKGQKRVWNGVKNGFGMGAKNGFKRPKKGISPNSTIWNGVERPFFAVPHLSTVFFAVPALFSPNLDDFRQKREKRSSKNGGTGKERTHSFPVSFPFRFFPFPFQEHLYQTHSQQRHKSCCAPARQCSAVPGGPRRETRFPQIKLKMNHSATFKCPKIVIHPLQPSCERPGHCHLLAGRPKGTHITTNPKGHRSGSTCAHKYLNV